MTPDNWDKKNQENYFTSGLIHSVHFRNDSIFKRWKPRQHWPYRRSFVVEFYLSTGCSHLGEKLTHNRSA
ncbi:hypothetical protein [Lacticaseibacillus manihotivorans]|uniref:hypothetical protein n=1 Tax=Lacticaseibacillus manihotivorans TaxID=88233 RepID=UPI001FB2F989|nr:hypothetical protein [Lacticaseibacillus manihotivorans]